jgi:hypothetical protein
VSFTWIVIVFGVAAFAVGYVLLQVRRERKREDPATRELLYQSGFGAQRDLRPETETDGGHPAVGIGGLLPLVFDDLARRAAWRDSSGSARRAAEEACTRHLGALTATARVPSASRDAEPTSTTFDRLVGRYASRADYVARFCLLYSGRRSPELAEASLLLIESQLDLALATFGTVEIGTGQQSYLISFAKSTEEFGSRRQGVESRWQALDADFLPHDRMPKPRSVAHAAVTALRLDGLRRGPEPYTIGVRTAPAPTTKNVRPWRVATPPAERPKVDWDMFEQQAR